MSVSKKSGQTIVIYHYCGLSRFFLNRHYMAFLTTKISSPEIDIFKLKNDGEKWSRIYFEIDRAPSEIPANLPGQFSPTGQIFLYWAAATLKGLGQFHNKF